MQKRSLPLFAVDAERLLGAAKKPLRRLANLNDATLTDVAAAREAEREARDALRDTEALFDAVTALPISDDPEAAEFPFEQWETLGAAARLHPAVAAARRALRGLDALHFPIAFPEVFLRDRPGFDVILGNPPWQEATIEEHAFWARHFPGLRGLPQREQEAEKARLRGERLDLVAAWEAERGEVERVRKALVGGAYPGMGTGDPDLYKAFCWRFWRLTAAEGGRIGVVLPRSALAAKGSTEFRREMFGRAASVDIVTLKNRQGWVFDDVTPPVHHQSRLHRPRCARGGIHPPARPLRIRNGVSGRRERGRRPSSMAKTCWPGTTPPRCRSCPIRTRRRVRAASQSAAPRPERRKYGGGG